MTRLFTENKGALKLAGDTLLKYSVDKAPLTSMRVAMELPFRYPSYDDVQAIAPGEGEYQQGMFIHEDILYLSYGSGAWIVCYDLNTKEELTVFRINANLTGEATEGFMVHRGANGQRYLTISANDSPYGNKRMCRYNINTLPARLSSATVDSYVDVELRSHITTDGLNIYACLAHKDYGLAAYDRFGIFDLETMQLKGELNFAPEVYGGPILDTTVKKVQNMTSHNGGFYLACGSVIDKGGTRQREYTTTPGIRKCSAMGGIEEQIMFNWDETLPFMGAQGYSDERFEFEGICSYNGSVYATVIVDAIDHSISNGLLIVELESDSIDLLPVMVSEGITTNDKAKYGIDSAINGITNPKTGAAFTTMAEILEWMVDSRKTTYKFFSSGESQHITDWNGDAIGYGRWIELNVSDFINPIEFIASSLNSREEYTVDNAGTQTMRVLTRSINSATDEKSICLGEGGAVKIRTTQTATSSLSHYEFANPNGIVGTINTTNSTTAFNTASDPRLKTDFIPFEADEAWREFDLIHAASGKFEFKCNKGVEIWGFDAHKIIDSVDGIGTEGAGPRELNIGDVYGEAETENGETVDLKVTPASIDQSKVVPYLVAVIADLRDRIKALEGK